MLSIDPALLFKEKSQMRRWIFIVGKTLAAFPKEKTSSGQWTETAEVAVCPASDGSPTRIGLRKILMLWQHDNIPEPKHNQYLLRRHLVNIECIIPGFDVDISGGSRELHKAVHLHHLQVGRRLLDVLLRLRVADRLGHRISRLLLRRQLHRRLRRKRPVPLTRSISDNFVNLKWEHILLNEIWCDCQIMLWKSYYSNLVNFILCVDASNVKYILKLPVCRGEFMSCF